HGVLGQHHGGDAGPPLALCDRRHRRAVPGRFRLLGRTPPRRTIPGAPRGGGPRTFAQMVGAREAFGGFRFIRLLIWVAIIGGFIWFGTTVPLGKYTLFGHVKRIWHSQETQDMVKGTEDAAKPVVDKAKKAVEAGAKEISK